MVNRKYYNRRDNYNKRASARTESSNGQSLILKMTGEILTPAKNSVDYVFLATVILLLTYGIIMLYSAGSAKAYANFNDSSWFIRKQLVGVAVGAVAMYVCSKIDYHNYGGKSAGIFYVFCLVLLVLVIAGLGTEAGGATRWLFGFQPSEIAKLAIIILYAYNLSRPSSQRDLQNFVMGFVPYMVYLGIYGLLLILQPHFSCAILMSLTAMMLLYVAGAKIKHFAMVGAPLALIAAGLVISKPYRLARVLTFFDPFANKQDGGWQIVQSLYAIGSGGIFGVGLGKSRQKFQSLPEPQNDFIFSVVCEELGLIGAILLIFLFIMLVIRGIKIASKAPDLFGTLLVTGIVGIIALQAIINIAVVTASMPVTGMPLPFFSFGSTALIITMAEMGIVLNVSRQSRLLP